MRTWVRRTCTPPRHLRKWCENSETRVGGWGESPAPLSTTCGKLYPQLFPQTYPQPVENSSGAVVPLSPTLWETVLKPRFLCCYPPPCALANVGFTLKSGLRGDFIHRLSTYPQAGDFIHTFIHRASYPQRGVEKVIHRVLSTGCGKVYSVFFVTRGCYLAR